MIYLNNAATSYPKPESVIEAINENLTFPIAEEGRTTFAKGSSLSETREAIGSLINIKSENVLLCPSATYALNLILQGLLKERNDCHCLTTTLEHNSVLRPLTYLKMKTDIEITYFEITSKNNHYTFDLESFLKCITEKTKLVVISHVSNVIGLELPIEAISMATSIKSIPLLIDASQSIGSVNIDFSKLQGEVYLAFTGHKGLYGPTGTGGFAFRGRLFEPIIQGGTGVRSINLTQPEDLPYYYESGTHNYPGFAGLREGVEYVISESISKISAHKKELLSTLIQGLSEVEEIQMYLPGRADFDSGILSFTIKGQSVEETGYILSESFGITCRAGLHCSPLIHKNIGTFPEGTIRLSLSYMNTLEEINTTIEILKKICRSLA